MPQTVLLKGLAVVMACCALAGCAGKRDSPQVGFSKGAFRQILERQHRGGLIDARELRPVPAMTAEEYEKLGDHYVRQGNLMLGFAQYERALRMEPGRSELAYKVGLLFLKKGLTDEAGRHFEAMLKSNPATPLAHVGMGRVHVALGDLILATAEFRQALTLDPSLWKVHNLLGVVYDLRELHSDAVAQFQAALQLRPDEPAILNNLGMSYYAAGRYEEAVRVLQQAVQGGAQDTRMHNNLGRALAKLERFHEGFLAFQRTGDEAKALNNLGMLYLQAGKPYNAAHYFEKAIQASPVYYRRAHENLKQARQVIAQWRSLREQSRASERGTEIVVKPAAARARTLRPYHRSPITDH